MYKYFPAAYLILIIAISFLFITFEEKTINQGKGAPPYYVENSPLNIPYIFRRFPELLNWKRPKGPLKVGLQAGHYRNDKLPDELKRLREKGGGSSGGGRHEWEINLAIAKETAIILKEKQITVDILPASVPKSYWADVFVAIHADGNANPQVSGFKVASPWHDYPGKSNQLVELLENEYQKATNLPIDPNITRNMKGYYAFSWWRFEHAIHPMTTAVIIETGFLTSSNDQQILIYNPQKAAEGIARGIIAFINQ